MSRNGSKAKALGWAVDAVDWFFSQMPDLCRPSWYTQRCPDGCPKSDRYVDVIRMDDRSDTPFAYRVWWDAGHPRFEERPFRRICRRFDDVVVSRVEAEVSMRSREWGGCVTSAHVRMSNSGRTMSVSFNPDPGLAFSLPDAEFEFPRVEMTRGELVEHMVSEIASCPTLAQASAMARCAEGVRSWFAAEKARWGFRDDDKELLARAGAKAAVKGSLEDRVTPYVRCLCMANGPRRIAYSGSSPKERVMFVEFGDLVLAYDIDDGSISLEPSIQQRLAWYASHKDALILYADAYDALVERYGKLRDAGISMALSSASVSVSAVGKRGVYTAELPVGREFDASAFADGFTVFEEACRVDSVARLADLPMSKNPLAIAIYRLVAANRYMTYATVSKIVRGERRKSISDAVDMAGQYGCLPKLPRSESDAMCEAMLSEGVLARTRVRGYDGKFFDAVEAGVDADTFAEAAGLDGSGAVLSVEAMRSSDPSGMDDASAVAMLDKVFSDAAYVRWHVETLAGWMDGASAAVNSYFEVMSEVEPDPVRKAGMRLVLRARKVA